MLHLGLNCIFALVASGQGQLGEAYLYEMRTTAELQKFSIDSSLPGADRSTKFLLPSSDDPELLPLVFQNVNIYTFHSEFMAGEFPDRFPGLGGDAYKAIAERRATRKYFACLLFRFGGSPPTFGFDIFTGDAPGELPLPAEAKWVYDHLVPKFSLGAVAYTPFSPQAIRNAEAWQNPGFPVSFAFGGGFGSYIPYVLTENYGRVRTLTPDTFRDANESGEISAQDILVLTEAPSDIEGIVAGIITGSLQDNLSHLSIRAARRGTPNAFVKDATAAFAPHEGKLVRLKIEATKYQVSEATLEEATAWWDTHRPTPVVVPPIDREYDRLDSAPEIPLDGSLVLNSKYGGKGANFGRLWHLVAPEHQDDGFVIPMRHYFQYVETQRVPSRANPFVPVTLAEYIVELLADTAFQGDSHTRFVELEKLRELFDDGDADPALVARVAARIEAVFGTTDREVRFRSSSNAEHLLEFNGAGIYSSTGGCAADDLDNGSAGPSRCDPSEARERGLGRAMKRVWGSLWNFRAFEERAYYSIPHTGVAMGILCSESFGDEEIANAVAFTGNPTDATDGRYLINCQLGDVEVVNPPPGVLSEQNVLTLDAGGVVTRIQRIHSSSLVQAGERVLTDEQLTRIGKVMHDLHAGFPFDLGGYPPERVLRDIEFKVNPDGKIVFKDIRLFVIPERTQPPPPELKVRVPEGSILCTSFWENRTGPYILRNKCRIGLKAGLHVLGPGKAVEIFEWVQFDPSGPQTQPIEADLWEAHFTDQRTVDGVRLEGYDFRGGQYFLDGAERVKIHFENVFLRLHGPEEVVLDAPALTWPINPYYLTVTADFDSEPEFKYLKVLPCDLLHLPSWTTDIELDGGDTIHVEDRFQDLEEGTGPAEIQLAEVTLAGETRLVNDYWRLVYTAGHHNDTPYPEYWALFDPPWELPGAGTAHAVQIIQGSRQDEPPTPPRAYLLDESFSVLQELSITSLVRRREGLDLSEFRRGDIDFSGKVDITDAILILRKLFLGEGLLICEDASDADDFGSLDITDPIIILHWLYLGEEAPAFPGPFECGLDDLPDGLPECLGPGCR